MLPITSCTVCRRFTQLFQYSIESIVNIIDEILILDDSCEEDVDYTNFAKYSNIKIIKSDEFGNDLGKKKQYLANISKHEIVMRWDDEIVGATSRLGFFFVKCSGRRRCGILFQKAQLALI